MAGGVMACAVEHDLDIYLRTVDQEERRLEAIEQEAERLLLAEFSPSRTLIVSCAMADATDELWDAIAIRMAGKNESADASAIGLMVMYQVRKWARIKANEEAKKLVGGGEC